jgi:hypothetical protein
MFGFRQWFVKDQNLWFRSAKQLAMEQRDNPKLGTGSENNPMRDLPSLPKCSCVNTP